MIIKCNSRTVLNSKTLLNMYITKYINSPTHTTPKSIIEKIRYTFTLNDKFSFLNDVNYSIVLSHISDNERLMFIRFFQVYLFKVYDIKRQFIEERTKIQWDKLKLFIEGNNVYYALFLTCFHYFF